MGDEKLKQELLGWVSEGMYAPWSQRTCLESNWKKDALDVLKGQTVVYEFENYSVGEYDLTIEVGGNTVAIITIIIEE